MTFYQSAAAAVSCDGAVQKFMIRMKRKRRLGAIFRESVKQSFLKISYFSTVVSEPKMPGRKPQNSVFLKVLQEKEKERKVQWIKEEI